MVCNSWVIHHHRPAGRHISHAQKNSADTTGITRFFRIINFTLPGIISAHIFISAFNDGQYHFKSAVGIDRVAGVSRNNDRLTGIQQCRMIVNDDFRSAVDDLNKCVERRYFLFQFLSGIHGDSTDVPGGLPDDGFHHDRARNIIDVLGDVQGF